MHRQSIQARSISLSLTSFLWQILPLTVVLVCQTQATSQDPATPVDKPAAEKEVTEKPASEKASTDKPATDKPAAEITQGHSYHGEAYNEGPAAPLI